MKRILVTGGLGYIGSHSVVELQQSGYDVVIVDNLSNSRRDVIDNIEAVTSVRPAFEEVDCTDMAAMQAVFDKYEGIQAIQEGQIIDAGNAMRERRLYVACRIKESLAAADDIYTVE